MFRFYEVIIIKRPVFFLREALGHSIDGNKKDNEPEKCIPGFFFNKSRKRKVAGDDKGSDVKNNAGHRIFCPPVNVKIFVDQMFYT